MHISHILAPRIRPRRGYVIAAALTGALLTAGPAAADGPTGPARDDDDGGAGSKPTVVLVHGAFADASSWNGVVERLQQDGYTVVATANPLRGLANDSAYTASVLKSIKGPIVLVGHSYGGAVISSAAAGNPQVKSLVYINAFMPDKGEVLGRLAARFPGSELDSALKPTPFQGADGAKGTDLYIQPTRFRDVIAADLPAATTKVMAATQRPLNASAFMDTATAAAWRSIPSWALVSSRDKAIAPDLERFEAKRARSHTVEVESSHVAMISHPDAVANLIRAAAADARPALAATGSRTLSLAVTGGIAGMSVIAGAVAVAATRKRRKTAR
ncbi:alpha/beta fold hydrolase [Streptomyces sp. NPDC057445]|uniref:alpha/beta fold hydrolase n=1 Tax=Streptomyces sp. NPDC057445 TaxID=3346136 RepID=UPI0036C4EF55